MADTETSNRPISLNYLWLVLVSIAYVALTFFAPVNTNNPYHLTVLATRLIQVSFIVPIIAIWWVAIYGVDRFKHYSYSVQGTPDGAALTAISTGLQVLVLGGFISSLFQSFRAYLLPASRPVIAFTIASNYLAMIFPLVSFIVIYLGARKLVALVKADKQLSSGKVRALLPFALFVVLFLVLLFKDPYRATSPNVGTISSFYMNDIALMATLVIPYIVGWLYGSLAVTYIKTFAKTVKGSIYRQAINRLANGILFVIVFSISIQVLGTLGTAFQNASLGAILILIYLILIAYGLAFVVIASGAKKLRKIEEAV